MRILISIFIYSLLIFPSKVFSQMDSKDRILGNYLIEDKNAKVRIYKCNGNEYCGKITWLKEPTRDGKIKRDTRNPDPALRNRKIEGMVILTGFEYNKDDKLWDEGEIYDPKSGKTYDAYMEFQDNNTLKIKGFVGFTWIGKSTYWKKID